MPPPLVPLIGKAAVSSGLSAGMGSIVSTGLSMLGGLFGSKKDTQNQKRQEEREDSRFQRASADAKLAGLHPLFALGAGGAGSPQFIAGQSETGSAIGDVLKGASRGVSRFQGTKQNPLSLKLADLQLKNAEINLRKNLIDEQLMASELRRTQQESTSTGQDAEFDMTLDESQRSKPKSKTPIKQPMKNEVILNLPFGNKITVPGTATAQEMEDLFGEAVSIPYGVAKILEAIKRSLRQGSIDRMKAARLGAAVLAAKRKAAKPNKAQPAVPYPIMP